MIGCLSEIQIKLEVLNFIWQPLMQVMLKEKEKEKKTREKKYPCWYLDWEKEEISKGAFNNCSWDKCWPQLSLQETTSFQS